jgi:hypothetical protein
MPAGIVDIQSLVYWMLTSAALALLVAALYKLANQPSSSRSTYELHPRLSGGYFITVSSREAEDRLVYASEMLKTHKYEEASKSAYEAVEILMTSACTKLGIDTTHSTLKELGMKATGAGLSNLEQSWLSFLDDVHLVAGFSSSERVARRSVTIAMQLKEYLKQAPISLERYSAPKG